MTNHELARQLLAQPELPIAIQYDGEYLAYSSDSVVATNTTGLELSIIQPELPCGKLPIQEQ